MDDELIELSTAIADLRKQLIKAQQDGQAEEIEFAINKVEVEIALEAKRTRGGGISFKVWVLGADGKTEKASGATHKVKLEMVPRNKDGSDFRVSGTVNEPPAK
jgi:Trypsin-co-occurring domain 2